MSAAYQASSEGNAANEAKDPDNRLFWRANRRRVDAEGLRDAMLTTSGELDLKVGGDSEMLKDSKRRTVYARLGRFEQDPTMALFDFPNASVSNEQRAVTNVPLQKPFFLNSPFVLAQAKAFAARLAKVDGVDARVALAYRLAYGRAATTGEVALAKSFLQSGTWEQYAQVLFGSNEFAFVD